MPRSGGSVDEMSETLLAENWQRCGDAVQDTFDVDVDHLVPFVDAEVVERRDRANAGVVDESVKLAVPLTCQLDKIGQVFAPFYVCARIGHLATRAHDAVGESLEALRSTCTEHDLCAALGEQERSRLADATACPRNGNDLAFDS